MEKAEVNYPLIQLIRKDGVQLYQMPVNNRIKHLAWNSVSEHVSAAKHHLAASQILIQFGPEKKKKNPKNQIKVYL